MVKGDKNCFWCKIAQTEQREIIYVWGRKVKERKVYAVQSQKLKRKTGINY